MSLLKNDFMKSKNLIFYFILIVLLFTYFAIGISQLSKGLPYNYSRDERTIMAWTLNLPMTNFEPFIMRKPHFYHYAAFSFYTLDYLFGRITGQFKDIHDYVILYKSFPTRTFIVGRLFSFLSGFSVLIILILFLKNHFLNKYSLILLILLIIINNEFLSVSTFLYPDMFFGFLYVLSTLLIYKSIVLSSKKYIYLSAIFVGLSLSAKQHGVLLFIPMLYAIYHLKKTIRFKELLLVMGIILFAFIITSPFYFLNLSQSVKDFIFQFSVVSGTGNFLRLNFVNRADKYNAIIYFLNYIIKEQFYIGFIIFIFGLITILINNDKPKISILLSAFLLLIVIGFFRFSQIRHVLASIVLLNIIFIDSIELFIKKIIKKNKIIVHSLIICLFVLFIFFCIENMNIGDKYYLNIEAKEWIESNIPSGTKIVNDMWPDAPPLNDTKEGRYGRYIDYLEKHNLNPYSERFLSKTNYLKTIPSYEIVQINYPWQYPQHKYLIIEPIEYYLNLGYNYYILTNAFYEYSMIDYYFMDNYRNMLYILENNGKLIKEFKQNNIFIRLFYYSK